MKNTIALLILIFLVNGCSQKTRFGQDFPEKIKLQFSQAVDINDFYMKSPFSINVSDTLIIMAAPVGNYSSDEYLVYLLNKFTGDVHKAFCKSGRGPTELMAINSLGISEKGELYFYDAVSHKLLLYDYLKDTIYSNIINFEKYAAYTLVMIEHDKYISSGRFDNNMYCVGNYKSGHQSFFLNYPELPDGVSLKEQVTSNFMIAKSRAYEGNLIKHPEKKIFAYFTRMSAWLQIVKLENDYLKESINYVFSEPKGRLSFVVDDYTWIHDKDSPECFISGTSSNEYIYLLYSENIRSSDKTGVSNKVYVFDWSGSKVKALTLNREVSNIFVDKNDNTIYGVGVNKLTTNNVIYHFNL